MQMSIVADTGGISPKQAKHPRHGSCVTSSPRPASSPLVRDFVRSAVKLFQRLIHHTDDVGPVYTLIAPWSPATDLLPSLFFPLPTSLLPRHSLGRVLPCLTQQPSFAHALNTAIVRAARCPLPPPPGPPPPPSGALVLGRPHLFLGSMDCHACRHAGVLGCHWQTTLLDNESRANHPIHFG